MKHEPTDAHPCGSCLRWPECNGVEWPECQVPKKAAGVRVLLDTETLTHFALNHFVLDLEAPKEERRKRGRIL